MSEACMLVISKTSLQVHASSQIALVTGGTGQSQGKAMFITATCSPGDVAQVLHE